MSEDRPSPSRKKGRPPPPQRARSQIQDTSPVAGSNQNAEQPGSIPRPGSSAHPDYFSDPGGSAQHPGSSLYPGSSLHPGSSSHPGSLHLGSSIHPGSSSHPDSSRHSSLHSGSSRHASRPSSSPHPSSSLHPTSSSRSRSASRYVYSPHADAAQRPSSSERPSTSQYYDTMPTLRSSLRSDSPLGRFTAQSHPRLTRFQLHGKIYPVDKLLRRKPKRNEMDDETPTEDTPQQSGSRRQSQEVQANLPRERARFQEADSDNAAPRTNIEPSTRDEEAAQAYDPGATTEMKSQEMGTETPSKTDKMLKFLRKKKSPTEETEEEIDQEDPEGGFRRRSTVPTERHAGRQKQSRILYTTDEEVRDALVEFAVFIVFLVLTSLVTLSVRHSYMFYFNDTMKKLFTTRELVIAPSVTVCFEKLITVPDWWDYLIYNFLVTLHGDMSVVSTEGSHEGDDETTEPPTTTETETREKREDKFNKHRINQDYEEDDEGGGGTIGSKVRPTPNRTHLDGRVFLHENLLLGPPRLRQIRVRKDTCFVNDAFIRYFNTCYDSYSKGAEEIISSHGGAPFRTMKELDSTPLWTILNMYATGGYTVDLTYDKETNLQIIKDLKRSHWLDRGSRLVLVEFNLYNENTDIFQSAKFIAEIPPTGGVLPQSQLQTVKHFSFITDKSLYMSVVYIFWYIMVVYYNINELNEIRKSGIKKYFRSLLNILDSVILLVCYLALVYNIWHTIKVKSLISWAKTRENYQSLDTLCFWNTIYVDMMAILAFLVWIKIFKFISFNKTLVQFTTTLKRCAKDLAGFSLMFGIVFLAYAQLGLLLFGTKHPDFRNFITSVLTMIRMILGDFQYNLIEQANRVLGPIYFLTYILLVFFILLNMFLAIIMETYNTVKSEITQGRSQLGSYVYKKLSALVYFITHCGRKRQNRDTINQPDPEHQDFTDDPTASSRYSQSKVHLRRNMSEVEAHYFEDVPSETPNKDMYRLNNRVSLLEEILEQLVTNMDAILKRVEKDAKKNK
ncbi:uncharacterized protein LOC132798308 [Drosophila nasuta]|uniref:uncharacterized protein LOC132798308 n=1 Tax=Drosophila nasuta TaxID=42062 RepID=UPI00295E23E1|nr:uncharacterized protein LOC132798308 [Drosophila nasuta]